MAELAKRGGDIPGIAVDAKEKAERDTRWVGEWSDDLTIAIALKEWGKAVDLVEKGTLIRRLFTTYLILRVSRTSQSRRYTIAVHETLSFNEPTNHVTAGFPCPSIYTEKHSRFAYIPSQ